MPEQLGESKSDAAKRRSRKWEARVRSTPELWAEQQAKKRANNARQRAKDPEAYKARRRADAERQRRRRGQPIKNTNYCPFDARLKYSFGITKADYESMLSVVPGCAICGKLPGKKRLAVDHDHRTGRVRGLLCSECNFAIGLLGDSPGNVKSAYEYLGGV